MPLVETANYTATARAATMGPVPGNNILPARKIVARPGKTGPPIEGFLSVAVLPAGQTPPRKQPISGDIHKTFPNNNLSLLPSGTMTGKAMSAGRDFRSEHTKRVPITRRELFKSAVLGTEWLDFTELGRIVH
jgi:hypothetical protein